MLDIVFFGTYDLTKPRQKIIMEAVNRAGYSCKQIHASIWKLKDKSESTFRYLLLTTFLGAFRSLPLVVKYIFCSQHKYVFIGYPGLVDVVLIWPIARLRKTRIIYDCYLPIYEILVEERKLIKATTTTAKFILKFEKFIHKIVDIIITDTNAHAEYISSYSETPIDKVKVVFVGAESIFEKSSDQSENKLKLLFYGQFAPLHGISCVLNAIKILERDRNIFFSVIGGGSKNMELKNLIESKCSNFEYKQWVKYEELPAEIANVDVCLGIFGETDKATRVIPNKVFQALSAGATVITGKTKAISELERYVPAAQLIQVPVGDEQQLAQSIRILAAKKENNESLKYRAKSFYPQLVNQLKVLLN